MQCRSQIRTTQLSVHTAHPSFPGNIVAVHIDKWSLRLANPHITCECLCVCCILHYSAIGTPPSLPTNIVAVHNNKCSFLLSAHITCECLCVCCILHYSAIGAYRTPLIATVHPPHCPVILWLCTLINALWDLLTPISPVSVCVYVAYSTTQLSVHPPHCPVILWLCTMINALSC